MARQQKIATAERSVQSPPPLASSPSASESERGRRREDG